MLSLLIAVDPESPESRSLLLKQVGPSGEPDRTVRFWALAGLLQGNVSYLRDALSIATSDPAPDVAGLARLALAPDDRKLHEESALRCGPIGSRRRGMCCAYSGSCRSWR